MVPVAVTSSLIRSPEKETLIVSADSTVVSPITWIVTEAVCCPSTIVTAPAATWKSSPEVAVPPVAASLSIVR